MNTIVTEIQKDALGAFGGKSFDVPAKYEITIDDYRFIWKVPRNQEEELNNGMAVYLNDKLLGLWRWQGQNDRLATIEEAEIIAEAIAEQNLKP